MRLVQDLYDHVHLVQLSVVSQLLLHAAEDLGEGALAQAVALNRTHSYFEKLLLIKPFLCPTQTGKRADTKAFVDLGIRKLKASSLGLGLGSEVEELLLPGPGLPFGSCGTPSG